MLLRRENTLFTWQGSIRVHHRDERSTKFIALSLPSIFLVRHIFLFFYDRNCLPMLFLDFFFFFHFALFLLISPLLLPLSVNDKKWWMKIIIWCAKLERRSIQAPDAKVAWVMVVRSGRTKMLTLPILDSLFDSLFRSLFGSRPDSISVIRFDSLPKSVWSKAMP